MAHQLAVNRPHVVDETIDGETILIHLGTGTYYSLAGVGAEIWQLVVAGAAREQVTASIESRYDADRALVESAVTALLEELLSEELVILVEASAPNGSEAGDSASASTADPGTSDGGAQFTEPVLHKYTDMQEFMLVDPLHDVEVDAGWPHVKAG